MLLFALAYIGGVLTIASPCILPVLPFVFARADQPFLRRGLPMLLGMGLTFAIVATLAAVGGGWAVQANEYGRTIAIVLLALFGVTLLFPELSDRLTRPLVVLGGRLSESADRNENAGSVWPSLLLGIATGLLWAPCAGPVLGLILTGAALQGANVQTTFLLLAYAAGAATSLALALLVGGRIFAAMKRSLCAGEWVRRGLGAAVLVAVVAIFFGADTGFLTQISLANTASLEQGLVDRFRPAPGMRRGEPSSSVVMNGDGSMMSANPPMMMSANAPNMAMTGKPAGKDATESSSSVVMPDGGAMMSANPAMMSANAPTMAMTGNPSTKDGADPSSSVVMTGGAAMMSASPSMMMSDKAPTMAMNGNPAAMMVAAEATPASAALPVEGSLPSLSGAVQWLNSPPLTAEQLKGKVVLVDFWTYSCINCLRSIPYVRAWAEKYKDQGLVVIGVHAPEFAFEKNIGNVKQAVAKLKIDYPVAVDNDYAIWRAFNNEYRPADYFIDAKGQIRHHFFGEGDYAESEKVIQQLLAEAGRGNVSVDVVSVSATGAEAASDAADVQSPETYIGFARSENFASPGGAVGDSPHVYATGELSRLNDWGLSGDWTVGGQSASLNKTDGAIAFRFHARDLHLVLGPSADGKPVRFRVTIDGLGLGESHGADVNADGEGMVTDHRLYQLVRQGGPVMDRTFTIQFLDPGVQAYAFTFG
jgi:cytochrome c biogenesis protein CcdA/thiol-disulfide isomerase/thioredoxin